MNPGKLLIRADASVQIGTGHVMRCLALAQAWRQSGGRVVFAMAETTAALERRLVENGCAIEKVHGDPGSEEDLQSLRRLAATESPEWIVLDGYRFDAQFQSEVKNIGRLLVVDDTALAEQYEADVVLNQNLHAHEAMYARRTPHTRLLLGSQYAMLRDEFVAYRDWRRDNPVVGTRVLVTMGGSDLSGLAPRILPGLVELPVDRLQIRVVVGGSANNPGKVEQVAKKFASRVEVIRDAQNMAELMAWADLAIAGAGTTCWEMCLLGLPSILAVVADNQEPIARAMEGAGTALNAGRSDELDCARWAERAGQLLMDAETRLTMSTAGRRLVDGRGRDRVLEVMVEGDAACA